MFAFLLAGESEQPTVAAVEPVAQPVAQLVAPPGAPAPRGRGGIFRMVQKAWARHGEGKAQANRAKRSAAVPAQVVNSYYASSICTQVLGAGLTSRPITDSDQKWQHRALDKRNH